MIITLHTTTDLRSAKLVTPVAKLNDRGKRIGTEYDASFDGQYLGTFATQQAAESAVNDHVYDLIDRGLVDGAALAS